MLIAHRRPGAARNRGCRRRFRGRARLHRLGSPTRLLTGRPRVLIRSTRAGARFPDCGSRIRSSERSAPDIWGAPSTGRRSPDRAPSSSRTSGSIQRFSKPGQREGRAPSTTGTPASTSTPPQWRPSKRMIDMRIRARDRRDSSGMPAMDAIRRIAEEPGAHRERVPGSTWTATSSASSRAFNMRS